MPWGMLNKLDKLNTKTVNDAITLHPVKDPAHMYRLHVHFNKERIQNLQQKESCNVFYEKWID